ncbi:hypothetical protein ACFWPH_27865 [Nocardia sp. NPDC058499]|uniref:hypothetical protein n=1 Tax=Nocardia sp. NPDC058499 TaxID=3346530 RepID=UPI003649631E
MNITDIVGHLARFDAQSSQRLHLVASENGMPDQALTPYVTDALTRYCFGTSADTHWAWPGRDVLADLEAHAQACIGTLLGARFVNLKPVSGLSAMTVAVSALSGSAGTVFSLAEADGGHGSTPFVARRFGLHWQPLPVDPHSWGVDAEVLARRARCLSGPMLIYLDSFMALFPHDLAAIRAAVGEHARIHYDGSHTLGLIAGGRFQQPLAEGADSLGGSVHKTWPGPVGKGVLATNDPQLAGEIDLHAAGWISHHHPADVVALAISATWMSEKAPAYAAHVVANARRLAAALTGAGFTVCAAERGGTGSHQVWVDIAPVCPAATAARLLYEAGMVVNAIDIPYLPAPGLRLGVQEATFLGFDQSGMDDIAALTARVLIHRESTATVAPAVTALRDRYRPAAEHLVSDELAQRRGWRAESRTRTS